MALIRIAGFLGEIRALHAKLLPDGAGTVSRNQKPGRGDLRPWKQPLEVATVPAGRKTIYRMGRDVASDANYWLSWPSVVHAIRGWDAEDTSERTYYSGDGAPKVTNNIMGLAAAPYPTASRPLGIPAPATPCLVSKNAGAWSGQVQTYFYTYTYINDWGWESAQAPVSAQLDRESDATATIGNFAAVPAGNYNITAIRIYRTQSGSNGSAEVFFLREIAIGTASTTDDNRALGGVLETVDWLPAPADLSCITALWNGMAMGISGNSFRLCEPYVPYAWPLKYEMVPPDAKPVAIGHFGQTAVGLTTGAPLLMAGSGPDAMDQQPMEDLQQACIAPRSVVSMGGVAWASEDGLCWIGPGGAKIVTAGLMTRDDWQALVPSSIVGSNYEGLYFGSYDDGSGRKGFFIEPNNPTGIYFLDVGYEGLHFDKLRDQLYVLDGTSVKKWDAGVGSMTVRFRSKEFRSATHQNFGWAKVVADSYPVTLRVDSVDMRAQDVAFLVGLRPTVFSAPAATTLRYTVAVASAEPVPLPSGFESRVVQLEVETAGAVQWAAVASSVEEIAQV